MSETITLPDGRVMPADEYERRLALLSKPFELDQIEKLPKQMKRGDDNRMACRAGTQASADGYYCGGFHARSIHLDYIGHAGITERLNEVDPWWTWEPMGYTPNGTPLIADGGMWGKLTVLGVTRIGFGDAGGKSPGPNAVKEIIGDFLRNAAMRFGVATYLWSKSEAAAAKKEREDDSPEPAAQAQQKPQGPDWEALFNGAKGNKERLRALRVQGRNANLSRDFPMFAAIEQELAALEEAEPIEGKVA
jgi:hypothetical protein